MQKNLLALLSFFLFSLTVLGSISMPDSIIDQHNQLYKKYITFNDSLLLSEDVINPERISIINDLIQNDKRIIDKYIPEITGKNELLEEKISSLQADINIVKDELAKYEDLRLSAKIVAAILLLLFFLFLILFTSKTIKLKKIRHEIEKYESSYEENKTLIESYSKENAKLKSKEIELEKNIEKIKQENNAKISLLKTDIDNALNENKLFQKRFAELNEKLEKEKTTRKSSEEENLHLKEKNFSLEQNLSEIKKLYEKEIETRKHIEAELRELLDKLKGL